VVVEVHEKLGELAALVSGARGVPLSSSVMVDREHLLALVSEVRRLLPAEVQQAGDVLAQRDEVLAAAQADADKVVAEARERAEELIDAQAVTKASRERADHIVLSARDEAKRLRVDADAWVDRKLADFEDELDRLKQQAHRGRDRLKVRGGEEEGAEPAAQPASQPASQPTSQPPTGSTPVTAEDLREES
jgi:cell division septum initiation protein DivIVA